MAQAVGNRTNEIAIRLALGAQASSMLGLLLGHGLKMIAAGIVLGLAASLMITPVIRSFLWSVTPTDTVTLTLVVGGLALVALLACYVPARRALKVTPVAALRGE